MHPLIQDTKQVTELPTVAAESELIQFLGNIEERSSQYIFSHAIPIAQISSKI